MTWIINGSRNRYNLYVQHFLMMWPINISIKKHTSDFPLQIVLQHHHPDWRYSNKYSPPMKLARGSSIINPLDAKQCHRKTDKTSSKYEFLKTTIGILAMKTHQHQHKLFSCGNFTSRTLYCIISS